MLIKITDNYNNVIEEGIDAESYLESQDYDSELELVLNRLDYTNINEVYWEELLIEKEIDLFY